MNSEAVIHPVSRSSSSLPYSIVTGRVVDPRCTPAAVEAEGVPDDCEARPVLPLE